jgi:hypothetical protein
MDSHNPDDNSESNGSDFDPNFNIDEENTIQEELQDDEDMLDMTGSSLLLCSMTSITNCTISGTQ